MIERVGSFLGLLGVLAIACAFSNSRRHISIRVILSGLFLQTAFAFFVLKSSLGKDVLLFLTHVIVSIVEQSDKGAEFVFGPSYRDHFFAFKVLPTIIFISSLFYLLTYWGIIQRIVRVMAVILAKTMKISGVEGLVAAVNVFVGQTESPLVIKPYLASMTKSEIMVMMTAGMGTVAGGVMAAYIGFGISAAYLISASLMAAPAAIVLAKILYPETEKPLTLGEQVVEIDIEDSNSFEAICNGASEGLKLALNVAAMLITFISLIALLNVFLEQLGDVVGQKVSFESIIGLIFRPLAFMIGVPWQDCAIVGQLIGEKIVLNEFIAYLHLSEYIKAGALSDRSVMLATYALCGFANFSSIGLQVGGIGSLAPSRKKDFAAIGLRALLGGILTGLMTACIAGIIV